ncbi:hypothetical protein NHX12_030377 [Muraenolepis orangiensis]|uniref:ubiquitinyl hydrolase 1 n=1 Tax=Muraenolepis orangiensis TaxID=630683 RepID=A0A9Q0EBM5_9TELE|nr:hypothetical protein NHX12_030377 [Muraenolepis orangiensis]
METTAVGKDKFFIVTRGKSWKGFCRGCIGRVEEELSDGELLSVMYSGSSSSSPGGPSIVKEVDTYHLTRHQAQLLLFVSVPSKRLELLRNPQLFAAICELSRDDIVVVKHKKEQLPALVKTLMKVGRKENAEDLLMIGFEVEFLEHEQSSSTKKLTSVPLFSAAEIVQVVPDYTVPNGLLRTESHPGGVSKKAVSRINSRSLNMNSLRGARQSIDLPGHSSMAASAPPLEVGSTVEVKSNTGLTVYGVIRWTGVPVGKTGEWAGVELDYDVRNCLDGVHEGQRYFTCPLGRALFVPLSMCSPDQRFHHSLSRKKTHKTVDLPPDITLDDSGEDAAPVSESQALSLLVGRMRGIQGHFNSCYLDATLFSLFCSSTVLDSSWQKPDDPEEFISILLQKVLCIPPLIQLRSNMEMGQGAYTYQIILEKEQVGRVPTVQQLLDASLLSCDLKFEEMPRFGKKYKMFPHIIPSIQLDLTDILHNAPRECFICGQLATSECVQCLQDRKLQPGKIKQYCSVCSTQVHAHPSRRGHCPRALESPSGAPASRHTMELFAVLCIQTSHYVSFVKYGPDPHSWLFFDSMADRCGDDQSGYNIPEVRACPQLGDFLSQAEEQVAAADPSRAGEPVRRLLCDAYMFLYQSASPSLRRENGLPLDQHSTEGGGSEGTIDCEPRANDSHKHKEKYKEHKHKDHKKDKEREKSKHANSDHKDSSDKKHKDKDKMKHKDANTDKNKDKHRDKEKRKEVRPL